MCSERDIFDGCETLPPTDRAERDELRAISYGAPDGAINIYGGCWDGCQCSVFDFVEGFAGGVSYNVAVRYCQPEYGCKYRIAAELIGEHTGMKVVDHNQVRRILTSMCIEGSLETSLEWFDSIGMLPGKDRPQRMSAVYPIVRGNQYNYYFKRDVIRWMLDSWSVKKKCEMCGARDCESLECLGLDSYDINPPGHTPECYEKSGAIYFLLHAATQQIKVGFSTQVEKRMKAHRASTPRTVKKLWHNSCSSVSSTSAGSRPTDILTVLPSSDEYP